MIETLTIRGLAASSAACKSGALTTFKSIDIFLKLNNLKMCDIRAHI